MPHSPWTESLDPERVGEKTITDEYRKRRELSWKLEMTNEEEFNLLETSKFADKAIKILQENRKMHMKSIQLMKECMNENNLEDLLKLLKIE